MGVNSPRSYAATGESAVHVSRVSLRQDETDGDGDGAAGDVGHAAGTLLVTGADRLASLHRAVNLGGSFGMGGDPFAVEAGGEVPGIVHVELVDLQNGALRAAWSSGDILRVRFSTAVNVKAGWPLDGGRDFVDALFGFSEPLGADYSGGWRDASVFVVTAIDVREGTPAVVSNASSGRNTTVQVLGNVRSAAGNGPSAADDDTLTVLGGDFGKTTVPMPVSFSAADPDNSAVGWGAHDTLTLRFSQPTSRDSATARKEYVDALFSFEPTIGDDYRGAWADDSTFVITILDVGAAAPAIGDASVTVVGFVFDAERQRPRSNGSATLSGSFGLTSPPRIVSFVVDDPAGNDGYGAGDTFTSGFLHAYIAGGSLRQCGDAGCAAGAEIVQVRGAEMD